MRWTLQPCWQGCLSKLKNCLWHPYPLSRNRRGGPDHGCIFPRLSQTKGWPGLASLSLAVNQPHSIFYHDLSTKASLVAQQESQAKVRGLVWRPGWVWFDERKYNGCDRLAACGTFRKPHLCRKRRQGWWKEQAEAPEFKFRGPPSCVTSSKMLSFLSPTFLTCKIKARLPWWPCGKESARQRNRQVQSVVREDPTSRGASQPVHPNFL